METPRTKFWSKNITGRNFPLILISPSNSWRKYIKHKQKESSTCVYLMDCEWRWRTQRAVSCLLCWRPCQRSPLRNRMLNQASCLFPRLNSTLLLSLFSPVYTNLPGKRRFELQTTPRERLGWRGVDDKTLFLPDGCNTARRKPVYKRYNLQMERRRWGSQDEMESRKKKCLLQWDKMNKIIMSILCQVLFLFLSLLLLSFLTAPVWFDPFFPHLCFFPPLLLSNISPYILPLLPFLHFLCSCLKLRIEQLVIEDHCLSSGPQDLQCLLLQLIFARQFFGLLFVCFFFSSSSSLSLFPHKLHKPFLKLDFHLRWTRSTRRVYAAFLPSIFLSLFFTSFQPILSSISSCELSPLSPARTGAPFSSWRRFKKKKKSLGCLLFAGWARWKEEAEKILIRQTVFLIPWRLLKLQDILTLFKVLSKKSADRQETLFCIKLITTFLLLHWFIYYIKIYTLRPVFVSPNTLAKMANKPVGWKHELPNRKYHQVESKLTTRTLLKYIITGTWVFPFWKLSTLPPLHLERSSTPLALTLSMKSTCIVVYLTAGTNMFAKVERLVNLFHHWEKYHLKRKEHDLILSKKCSMKFF